MDPQIAYNFLAGLYPRLFNNKNRKAIYMFYRLLCSYNYNRTYKKIKNDFKDSRNLNLAFTYLASRFKYEYDNNTVYLSLILTQVITHYGYDRLYFNDILENSMIYFYFVDKLGSDVYSKIVDFTIDSVFHENDYIYLKEVIFEYESSSPIEKIMLFTNNTKSIDIIREKFNKTFLRDMNPVELEFIMDNKITNDNFRDYYNISKIFSRIKKIGKIYGYNLKKCC